MKTESNQLGHLQSATTESYLGERVAERAKQDAAASWGLPEAGAADGTASEF